MGLDRSHRHSHGFCYGTALALGAALLARPASGQESPLHSFPQVPRSWDLVHEYRVAQHADGSRFVADVLLLTLHPDASAADVERAAETAGARVVGAVPSIRLLRVQLCDGGVATEAQGRFAALAGVEHAELDGLGEGGQVAPPNDTYFPQQWHLANAGQTGGKPGADIEALDAWELGQGAASVTLAVLDSGIDFGHPEFVGRALPGFDFVNEDANPTFDHPHGIFVTGLAAANTGNAFGVAGIDRLCSIVPVKVLDAFNGGTTTDLIQGLDYCAQQGVDVVNMSLIGYPGTVALQNAIAAARAAGCILVACAGNGGLGNADVSWPGASPQTMSIGATDAFDARASFSGTGAMLDFVAPGSSVITASQTQLDVSSPFSGCSGATPVAAGIVSLLKDLKPALTHDEARQLLQFGAEDGVGPPNEDTPGEDNFFGWGRVNAWRSLAGATPCAAPVLYGAGKTTSLGTTPFLATAGLARQSFGDFSIGVHAGIPGSFCVLMRGSGPANVPALGGTLWIASPIVREDNGFLDAAGSLSFPIAIDDPKVGTTGWYQVFLRDPTHPDGTGAGLSNAVEVAFCP